MLLKLVNVEGTVLAFSQTVFSNVVNVYHLVQVNHVDPYTTGCQGGVYLLDFNMAGRSEDESVSNSSGESR